MPAASSVICHIAGCSGAGPDLSNERCSKHAVLIQPCGFPLEIFLQATIAGPTALSTKHSHEVLQPWHDMGWTVEPNVQTSIMVSIDEEATTYAALLEGIATQEAQSRGRVFAPTSCAASTLLVLLQPSGETAARCKKAAVKRPLMLWTSSQSL